MFIEEKDEISTCPLCGEILKTVVGELADCSYGEYQECSNPHCNYGKN